MTDLPIIHPIYGGRLTYIKDIPIGAHFHVCNGNWNGEIIEEDGIKKMHCFYTKEKRVIGMSDYYLWIEIIK